MDVKQMTERVENMKVVIAIDSFKGSMTSLEAGESASAGIKRVYPNAKL